MNTGGAGGGNNPLVRGRGEVVCTTTQAPCFLTSLATHTYTYPADGGGFYSIWEMALLPGRAIPKGSSAMYVLLGSPPVVLGMDICNHS